MNRSWQPLIFRQLLAVALSAVILTAIQAQDPATETESPATEGQDKPVAASVDQALLDKLERYLTGSKWTGNFTITGKENQKLNPETYEITKAKHTGGDSWLLTARIKYGDKDRTVDLPPLEIKWVGDSPVITVDKMLIPLMGVFDARVIIRHNKYAGTWTHNAVGGHLFGVIERLKPAEKKEPAEGDGQDNRDKDDEGRVPPTR